MRPALLLLLLPTLADSAAQESDGTKLAWEFRAGDRFRYGVVLGGPATEILGLVFTVTEVSPTGEALLEVRVDHHARRDRSGRWVDTDAPGKKDPDPDRWLLQAGFKAVIRRSGEVTEIRGYEEARAGAIKALPEADASRVQDSWKPAHVTRLLKHLFLGGLDRTARAGSPWESEGASPGEDPGPLAARTELLSGPEGVSGTLLYRRLKSADGKEAGRGRLLWDSQRGSLVQSAHESDGKPGPMTTLVHRADRPGPATIQKIFDLIAKLTDWDYETREALYALGPAALPYVAIHLPQQSFEDFLPPAFLEDSINFTGRLGGKRNRVARGGGGAATEDGVLAGLKYLLRLQVADGLWKSADDPPDSGEDRVYLTGCALLAMSGAGYSRLSMDTYGGIRVGLAFDGALRALARLQDDQGLLSPSLSAHAIAAWALTESPLGLTSWDWQSVLLYRAIPALRRHQIPGGGWPAKAGGPPDVRTTTYAVLALSNAVRMGIVPRESLREAIDALAAASKEDPAAAFARVMAGVATDEASIAANLAALPEEIEPAKAPWTALLMRQAWSFADPKWTSRMPGLIKKVLAGQRTAKDPGLSGSWDSGTTAPAAGGRIASTAFGMLALESFYFHPNLKGLDEEVHAKAEWTDFKAAYDANPRKASDVELLQRARRLVRFYEEMGFSWLPELKKCRDELQQRIAKAPTPASFEDTRRRIFTDHALAGRDQAALGPAITAWKAWMSSAPPDARAKAEAEIERLEALATEALQGGKREIERLSKSGRETTRKFLAELHRRLQGSAAESGLKALMEPFDEGLEKQLARTLVELHDLRFGSKQDAHRLDQLESQSRELRRKMDPDGTRRPGDLERYVLARHAPESAEALRKYVARTEKERIEILALFPDLRKVDEASRERLELLEMRLWELLSLCGVPWKEEERDPFVADCLAKHAPEAVEAFWADRCGLYESWAAQALAEIREAEADLFENDRDANGARDFWVGDLHALYGLCPAGETGTRDFSPIGAMKLIQRKLAEADRSPLKLEGSGLPAPKEAAPFNGYRFGALAEFEEKAGDWKRYDAAGRVHPVRFGFYAVPAKPGRSGRLTFIVTEKGRWKKDTRGEVPRGLPADPEREGWVALDRAPAAPPEASLRRLAEIMKGMAAKPSEELQKEGDRLIEELTDGDREREDEMLLLAVRKFAPELIERVEDGGRRANEANAKVDLKFLLTAELDFRSNDRDGNGRNDFWVGDVHGLFYLCPQLPDGTYGPDPQAIRLIDAGVANADVAPLRLPGKYRQPARNPKARRGYLFRVLRERETAEGWAKYGDGKHVDPAGFAFVAVPAEPGRSGSKTFLISEEGRVWAKDTQGRAPRGFPLDPAKEEWVLQE